ncbi:MAG TPA: DMT family transporter [Candidatus Tectomicrobia bacterium]|nr:DMT family transporter [Candidatus Tectomicrobia bacterium]
MPAPLLVALLLLVEGLYYVFARLLVGVMPPAASAFWMLALATLEVAALARGRIDLGVARRHWRFFLVIGLLVGVNTNMGFAAMRWVDPGTAALLTRTSVLFGVGLGVVWLGDRLTARELAGGALAVAGTVVVTLQPGDYFRLGAVVVVAATFLYALHSAVVKRHGGAMRFIDFFFFRLAATAAVLLVLAAAQGVLAWPDAAAWPLLVLAATVNVVMSRALYYLALRRLSMSRLTLILTASPVVTILWSSVLFGSVPSAQEAAGGAAILAGVALVSAARAAR